MVSLPDSITALVTGENHSVSTKSIPFETTAKVQNLDPDEIIVRVRAVGLNPTDWKHILGSWGGPGFVGGCDSAGDVVKIGRNVKNVVVGDRVAGFVRGTTQPDNGSFAEYVRFDSAVVFKMPAEMSYEEGASFPIPHCTATQALYMRLNLPRPTNPSVNKDIIIIWGGSTAVGHHAVQLAHHSGLRVFATASTAAHAKLKELGADACFDYKDPEVVRKIKSAAGEPGIAMALDAVNSNGSTDLVIDSIGKAGGRVVTTLPSSAETVSRRPDVKVEFTIVHTNLGKEFTFEQLRAGIRFPAMPRDKERIADHLTSDLPILLQGWKNGVGSPKYQAQRLRIVDGGFEGIVEGLKVMQKGEYGREKLVVRIA